MQIPSSIVAGDSVTWRDEATADALGNAITSATHTLTYAIRGAQNLTLTGSPYLTGWEVTASAAQTITLLSTRYYWQAYATHGVSRITLGQGQLTVTKNLSTQSAGAELRSQTQIDLDNVEAAIRAMISNQAVQEYSIAGRSIKKMVLSDLIMLRDQLRYELVQQRRQELIANGQGDPHSLFVRF
jgi:hypothetical protein